MKVPFHKPTEFPSVWAMINLSPSKVSRNACEVFCNELSQAAIKRGIQKCPPPVLYEQYDVNPDSIETMLTELKNMMEANADCQFLMVVLPEDNTIRNRVYGEIKKLVR
jgi:hypothetical protein